MAGGHADWPKGFRVGLADYADGRQVVHLLRGTASVPAPQLDGKAGLSSDAATFTEWCQSDRDPLVERLGRHFRLGLGLSSTAHRFPSIESLAATNH